MGYKKRNKDTVRNKSRWTDYLKLQVHDIDIMLFGIHMYVTERPVYLQRLLSL